MEVSDFEAQYVLPFTELGTVYDPAQGWIVWRLGTGENVELLHIRTFVKRRGYGRVLFYRMLDELDKEPPYYSVFGFTRVSNEEAMAFYGTLGFNLQTVHGLYAEGKATLFWQSHTELVRKRDEYEDRLHC